MKTFFQVLGVILLVLLSMAVGSLLYFKLFSGGGGADHVDDVEGMWLLNPDLSAVKEDDEIQPQNYVVCIGTLYDLLRAEDGEPVIDVEGYVPNEDTYQKGTFGLFDVEANKVSGTLNYESGMTWAEWCDSSYNEYDFACVSGFLMLNAEAQGFV